MFLHFIFMMMVIHIDDNQPLTHSAYLQLHLPATP